MEETWRKDWPAYADNRLRTEGHSRILMTAEKNQANVGYMEATSTKVDDSNGIQTGPWPILLQELVVGEVAM